MVRSPSPNLGQTSAQDTPIPRPNQWNNGIVPPDNVLKAKLLQYTRERLSQREILARLETELYYHIRKTKLNDLLKKFEIPTVRRLKLSEEDGTQLVLAKLSDDITGRQGVNTIHTKLAHDMKPIPRRVIRQAMQFWTPEGLANRFPGARQIKRGRLTSFGPFHEISMDGHDKLGAQALEMGGVGLPIYGCKDKYSSAILWLTVVPNNRLADTIGHVFLDMISEMKAIPLQITIDAGSETGQMIGFQKHLRPDIPMDTYPAYRVVKSTRNISIEGGWHWFLDLDGRNIIELVQYGQKHGLFDHTSSVHRSLFHWIWPPALQAKLDEFIEYWNSHTIRYQHHKQMPSLATPRHIYTCCEQWGDCNMAIPLQLTEQCNEDVKAEIEELRKSLDTPYKEAFRWVDDDFDAIAHQVYEEIGSPKITVFTAWEVFMQMVPTLKMVCKEI